ncbi:MAG: PDZ domain-containing protein [Myxococcales bacterium]|nr:PDZ domain-containing protein [Myxococcales bacterium]
MLIALAIAGLCVLIVVHEGGHFIVARLCGMRVDRFSVGFGPALIKFKRGETIYQISAIPLGGFVQIAGLNPGDDGIAADDPRAYPNRPVYQRMATIFAGPGTNYLFAAITMVIVYMVVGTEVPGKLPMVAEVMEGKPAAAAGLQIGDELVVVDGKKIANMDEVSPILNATQGRAVEIVVTRNAESKTVTVKPEKDGERWRIGIAMAPRQVYAKVPAKEAILAGLKFPYEYTTFILHGFAQIFQGKQKAEFSGPVGIVRQMKGELARGPADGFRVLAIISVYLGLFNLLPLPALDGGRLVFLGVEGLSRRRVNQRVESMVHLVGMAMLLCFMLYITVMKDFGLGKIFQ